MSQPLARPAVNHIFSRFAHRRLNVKMMRGDMRKKYSILLVGLGVMLSGTAQAQVKDIEVAARTFKFIEGAPSGSAVLGIVSDPSVSASSSQANAIKSALGSGKSFGGINLSPKIVSPDSIDGVDLLFVTDGLGAQHSKIGQTASAKKLLSFSTDKSCVESKHCFMSVQSSPKVEILVSRTATDAAGLKLKQALKMMVEERD